VAYPSKDGETCPITAVACDEKSFSITLSDGSVHTFKKDDAAFKTYGTTERLEKGMDICM